MGPEADPALQAGIGFHLQPDGQWTQEKIPQEVLEEAKFSGHLTIHGYRSTVFETPKGDQWAQKSVGTPATASSMALRVASRVVVGEPVRMLPVDKPSVAARVAEAWLRQADRANDLVSQISEVMEDERADLEYDQSIVEYCDEALSTVAKLQDDCREMTEEFIAEAHKLAEAGHEKVQKVFADKVRDALIRAALEIKTAGSRTLGQLAHELSECRAEAERK